MNNKGILLVALGKKGYKHMAYNLAFSLKQFNKDLSITLLCDDAYALRPEEHKIFDRISVMNKEHYLNNGKLDPALAKISIYQYLPYKHNLYLDVDAVGINDIEPVLDKLIELGKFYSTQVVSEGKREDKIDYTWASNDVMWDHYNLPEDATLQTIQSSFAYIKKCKQSENFFKAVRKNFDLGVDLNLLKWSWGGTVPDELLFSVTAAQKGIDVKSGLNPIFFGNKYNLNFKQINEQFQIFSLYGNGGGGRTLLKLIYVDYIEKELIKTFRKAGLENRYKVKSTMKDKHANNGHLVK